MIVLGIWDGHNSSASLIEEGKIVSAVNEERFTKRKLEPLFPVNSIKYCLSFSNLKPRDISHIAISTSDWSTTISRAMSWLKGDFWYYRRRHKTDKPITWDLDLQILNQTGKLKSNKIFRKVSLVALKKTFMKLGFDMNKTKLHLVNHHKAHAASAYFTSGYKKATCLTLDALGDGYSSSVSTCEKNEIKNITQNKTKDSLGLFFQEVTSIAGMRILEDEGKVMALSDYAYVDNKKKNPMRKFFSVDGTKIKSNLSLYKRYNVLKNLHWRNKPEDFAYMAQDALEFFATKLFDNSVKQTGIKNVVWAGGIASNIKMNMKIRQLDSVDKWHVFPDMGDGGLSVGAALFVSNKLFGTKSYKIKDVYLGPEYDQEHINEILKRYKSKIDFEYRTDASKYAGELVSDDNIVFWHQGRMEFGPRALGNRSILASAFSVKTKDILNMKIKRRSFYQPFCPSLLSKDANKFIDEKPKDFNRFMIMGYMLKPNSVKNAGAVMNIDKSIRPQIVEDENKKYSELIRSVKKNTGNGIVLNTSFNLHGKPIVMTPEDAIKTQIETKNKHLFIGNYSITLK